MWSKLLYVGEDEDDIVKPSFVEDVDDKDGVVIFEDAEDHTVKVVLVQEAEDGEVYMASVEDGEDDEDCMVKVVVAEDIGDGATKAASAKDGMAWFKFKMLKLLAWCLVKMTQNKLLC